MTKNERTSHKVPDEPELEAAKPADAAVRRALIEAREEFLLFLYQRVGNKRALLQRSSASECVNGGAKVGHWAA
jgi:RNA polymerase sigma-70 factor (ECF subfamily)